MAKVWATPEYEDKLLEEILHRVERELRISHPEVGAFSVSAHKLVESELLTCYEDPVYFIENYLYTDKNPGFFSDRIQTLVPFLLFDYQVETIDSLLAAVEEGESAFIEKSRQMGISWIVCAFALWGWLFRDWKIHFLSQKEDYVDKIGDMQSLFQKIRFMVAQLPKWMLPKEFSISEHMPRLRIFKPAGYGTGAITGESANDNASTGGTYKFVFMDEMSKMKNASRINTAVKATTWSVFYNSTPYGKFNEYYRMRTLAMKGKMRHIRLHWSLNPMYTREWYEWKTRDMTPEQIAQELEISYDASVTGRVYQRFANRPAGDCDFWKFSYDPYLPLYCSIDHSHGGMDNHAVIFAQTTPEGKIRIIDSVQFPSLTSNDEAASLLSKQLSGWKFDDAALAFYDRIRDWKPPTYVGDPYDTNARWNDTSISKIYQKYGIFLNVPQREKPVEERIRVCQQNMWRVCVNVDTEDSNSLNWEFVSAMQNARYPERNEWSQSTSQNVKPIHDGTSHFRTSFEYLVNFIVESEESMGIVAGRRQERQERRMVEVPNYITGDTEWREEWAAVSQNRFIR